MAAVRCAARRLGGSLLQRTQAAITEERRRHLPSSFMRSRQISIECAREIQVKKVELRDLVSKTMQKKAELQDALARAEKNSESIGEHDMRELEYLFRQKIDLEPHDTPWYRSWRQFATRAGIVLEKCVKVTVSVMVTACVVSIINDQRVNAHPVDEENREGKPR